MFGLSETSSQGGIAYVGAWGPIVAGIVLVGGFVWHALHSGARRPLLDLQLFRSPAFAAASVTVLLIAAVVFGALLVLPLYFQVARGASTLATGLLLAPQGFGAALVMPISGRLSDRVGGGVVSVFGLGVMTVATLALTQLSASTPSTVTSAILLVRGVGLGCSMMPTTAAAYTTVSRAAVPRATTIINVFQRVGGSLGSALLAVVLEDQIKAGVPSALRVSGGSIEPLPSAVRERLAAPLTEAFNHTLWWAVALTALAILPAIVVAAKAPKPAGSDSRANPPSPQGDGSSQRQLHDAPPRPQPSHASTG